MRTDLNIQTNRRTDKYGGSPSNRARIVVEIIEAVRNVVPKSFCIGLKLNSADLHSAGELEDSIEQIRCIEKAGIDFLEISGGSYENPRVREQKHVGASVPRRTTAVA